MSPSLVYIQIQVKNSKNRVILNQESTRCFDAKFGLHKIEKYFFQQMLIQTAKRKTLEKLFPILRRH